jgi:arylsulfatase
MRLAPPAANPILYSYFFHLYRDPREDRPAESTKYGVWAGGMFAGMINRHMAMR